MAQTAPPDRRPAILDAAIQRLFERPSQRLAILLHEDAWGDNLDRLRLTYDGKYGDWFAVHFDYDNEIHEGN